MPLIYGLPAAMLCDNGSPWGGGEHTGLTVWLMRLGIRVHHGQPSTLKPKARKNAFIELSMQK